MVVEQGEDPLIGSKVGPVRIEKRLAAGGMGVVYRARHAASHQQVALKILSPVLGSDQEYVTRFFREAGAAGQIHHPNVVRVIDVGKHQALYYLVMEYVEGETLDELLERERRFSLERATRLVRGIAAGLAAAHQNNIIHRDVKPGNVIVTPDGQPHLTDFGLARQANMRWGMTTEGTFLGTPEYASPEQVEGHTVDHRSDLYSLGVTYYQMLTGSLPFEGESPMEIAVKRVSQDPRRLEHAFPSAVPQLCEIVHKLLQRNPAHRHQNARELLRDLDDLLTWQQTRTARVRLPVVAKAPVLTVEGKRRIRTILYWFLMALAVCLAFFSGALARRGRYLEMWRVRDSNFTARMLLAGASALAAAAALVVYRRELVYSGCLWTLLLLVPLMLLGGLVAGTVLDREEVEGPLGLMDLSVRALVRHLASPPNLLFLGLLCLFVCALTTLGPKPRGLRILLMRIGMPVGFLLLYGFGTRGAGWAAPLRNFTVEPILSIPLATVSVLACLFAGLLSTGFEFRKGVRWFGVGLMATGALGLYAFAVLSSEPNRQGGLGLLGEPFVGLASSFLRSGTALLVVVALGVVIQAAVAAGMRRHDRFYGRKPSPAGR